MWTIKRSEYRGCLKYFRSAHRLQSERYQQMRAVLELLRSHSASGSAVLGCKTRAALMAHLDRIDSVNHFYTIGIEQALQSTQFLRFKPIVVWDCYRVLHDQENMNHFLRGQYLKMRPLLSQLWSHYGYGTDSGVLGASFVRHLKRRLHDLEKTQQRHGEWLRYLHHCLLERVGVPIVKPSAKWYCFKQRDAQVSSGIQQFFRLMAHCNREFTAPKCTDKGIPSLTLRGG